ncbi:MAG: transporter related protein [Ilumatobacteraceae bacterium]|nr:transporter related protein [Ilumatobacteraceae bacterium]
MNGVMPMMDRLRRRQSWTLFGSMHRAAPQLATAWWVLIVLRGALPALLAVAIGVVVGAAQSGDPLGGPLVFVGIVFVVAQVLTPIHQAVGANLGNRTADWLNGRLVDACVMPAGIGHLEDPGLVDDLTMARDFDLGINGPPLYIAVDFIAGGLVQLCGGLAAAVVLIRFAWWAPVLLVTAWGCTHWLLRESGVWRDRNTDEVRAAQRHTDYAFRLAVDPPVAKELRMFGLGDWSVDRFTTWSRRLHDLKWHATRLREKPLIWCLLIVVAANVLVFWDIAAAAYDGRIALGAVLVYAQTAFGTSAIAFGGLNWALDGAAAPAAAVARIGPKMASAGALGPVGSATAAGRPEHEIRFRDVGFSYPSSPTPVLEHFDLTIPAGTSLAIVGQNGAGKTTLAKLLCRLYDPTSGAIEIDGQDMRDLDLEAWRHRVAAVFQDFVRYELPLRDNVAPPHDGGPRRDGAGPHLADHPAAAVADTIVLDALHTAGGDHLADLDTILARGYPGGTDLSGGQWQRVALARALYAVRLGAGVVLLDEPTAQLDVRGEAEIFERLLAATRQCTTILISHRFSTVRRADRICVVEHGRVIELGTHDELMSLGGRYHTMYELQAARFVERDDSGLEVSHESL